MNPIKRIPVVSKDCIGCGACATIADGVFRINNEGRSEVIELPDYEGKGVEDAIAVCGPRAISWKEV